MIKGILACFACSALWLSGHSRGSRFLSLVFARQTDENFFQFLPQDVLIVAVLISVFAGNGKRVAMLLCQVITRSALLYPLDAIPYPTQNGPVLLRDLAIHSLNNSSESTTSELVVGRKQFLNLGCSEGLSSCL